VTIVRLTAIYFGIVYGTGFALASPG